MYNDAKRNEGIRKLAKLIESIKFAMLTTVEPDGTLHARPMACSEVEFDGDLWFFTRTDSAKTEEVRHDQNASVSFANPKDQTYVTMAGKASIVHDRARIEKLWSPLFKAYFPQGLDDPHLALLKVEVERAEYWDSPGGKVVQLLGFAKAQMTGEPYHGEGADHERLDLS